MAEKGFKVLREPVYRIIDPVVRWLIRLRIHPNASPPAGCGGPRAAGLSYPPHQVRPAGVWALFGGG